MPACSVTSKERAINVRIPINLASDPFRRDRPVLFAAAFGAIALGVVFVILLSLIVTSRSRMGDTRARVAQLNQELTAISTEQARLDATLRQPANASILERSLLLNTLVERKSVSWTKIFADLEAVLPPNVRIIQVRLPQIDSANQVLLDMVVGSQSPEPVITFLKQLQASPRFGPATVHNSVPPTDNEPLYRYRVSVDYGQKL
jgi:type IV pilus assembly protein PilN